MSKPLNIRNTRPLALFAILLIAACGQKGPLYLPGNPSEIRTEIPQQDPQPEAGEIDEEDDGDSEQSP